MMAVRLKFKLWIAVVVLAVVLPLDTILVYAMARPTMEDRARHWAGTLTDIERSQAIRSGNLPSFYHRAVKNTLGRSGARRLVLDKIADYRRLNPALSNEREAFLTRLVSDLTADRAYGTGPNAWTQEDISNFTSEAKRLFPLPADHAALFLFEQKRSDAVGASEPGLRNRLAARLMGMFQSTAMAAAEAKREEATCQCSMFSDYCDWFWQPGGHCCEGQACNPSQFDVEDAEWVPACGFGGFSQCDGMCTGSEMNLN